MPKYKASLKTQIDDLAKAVDMIRRETVDTREFTSRVNGHVNQLSDKLNKLADDVYTDISSPQETKSKLPTPVKGQVWLVNNVEYTIVSDIDDREMFCVIGINLEGKTVNNLLWLQDILDEGVYIGIG